MPLSCSSCSSVFVVVLLLMILVLIFATEGTGWRCRGCRNRRCGGGKPFVEGKLAAAQIQSSGGELLVRGGITLCGGASAVAVLGDRLGGMVGDTMLTTPPIAPEP